MAAEVLQAQEVFAGVLGFTRRSGLLARSSPPPARPCQGALPFFSGGIFAPLLGRTLVSAALEHRSNPLHLHCTLQVVDALGYLRFTEGFALGSGRFENLTPHLGFDASAGVGGDGVSIASGVPQVCGHRRTG
jgi:hypothetical protein